MSYQLPEATKLMKEIASLTAERDRLKELAEKNEQAADVLWAQRDKLRLALDGVVRCWDTDIAIGYPVDRYYYSQAKKALQEVEG